MQALAAVQFKGRILWIIGIQVGNNPVYVCLGFNQCVAGPCSCRRGRGFKAHVDTLRWDRRVCPVHPLQHIIPGARPQLSGNLIVHVSVYDHTAGAQVHALNLVRVAPYRLPLLRSWVYLVKICKYILGRFSSWRQVPCIGCCRCFRCRLGISGRLVGRQSVPYILAALFGLYRVGQAINELLFVHVVAIGNVLCLGHLQQICFSHLFQCCRVMRDRLDGLGRVLCFVRPHKSCLFFTGSLGQQVRVKCPVCFPEVLLSLHNGIQQLLCVLSLTFQAFGIAPEYFSVFLVRYCLDPFYICQGVLRV